MWYERAEAIAESHPCLAGHFPGNPIVPGTLILDSVIDSITRHYPDRPVDEVVNVKFMLPLKPGQSFEIRVEEKSALISFDCLVDEITIATGKLTLIKPGSSS